jgi:hypothetical protein
MKKEAMSIVKLCAQAVNTVANLKILSPTRVVTHTVPKGAWNGQIIHVKHLRLFGCKAWVLIPKKKRKTWNSKSSVCIFAGYPGNSKTYRLIDRENLMTVIVECNVNFVKSDRNTPMLQEKKHSEGVYAVSEPTRIAVQSQPVHLSPTAEEHVKVEEDIERSETVMHEEETVEDHPASESEGQRRKYSLRKMYQRSSRIT